jgi:hypothetical protein
VVQSASLSRSMSMPISAASMLWQAMLSTGCSSHPVFILLETPFRLGRLVLGNTPVPFAQSWLSLSPLLIEACVESS